MWFLEEVGELAGALRSGTPAEQAAEFADVLAWLATLANIAGIDLEAAARAKYGGGCPGCGQVPCVCAQAANRANGNSGRSPSRRARAAVQRSTAAASPRSE